MLPLVQVHKRNKITKTRKKYTISSLDNLLRKHVESNCIHTKYVPSQDATFRKVLYFFEKTSNRVANFQIYEEAISLK